MKIITDTIVEFVKNLSGRLSAPVAPKPFGVAEYSSWDFPLLRGEYELSNHIIVDKEGVPWVVCDDRFFNNKRIYQNITNKWGEFETVRVFTHRGPWFPRAKQQIESDFEYRCPGINVKILGFLSRAASGTKGTKWQQIYPKYGEPEYAFEALGLVYKIRVELSLRDAPGDIIVCDTQQAFFDDHGGAYWRVKYGPINQISNMAIFRKSQKTAVELLYRIARCKLNRR
ncbi:MAG: hypothetical protein FWE64_03740 [Alphaproteobacteria bacterium]|nr:hypothetical protein [Alphaproteobacteria bacterium]